MMNRLRQITLLYTVLLAFTFAACGGSSSGGAAGGGDTAGSDGGSSSSGTTASSGTGAPLGEAGTVQGGTEIFGTNVGAGENRPASLPAGVLDPAFIIIAKVTASTTRAVVTGSVTQSTTPVSNALVTAVLTRAGTNIATQTVPTADNGAFAASFPSPQQSDVIFVAASKVIDGILKLTNTVKLEIDLFGKVDALGNPIFGRGGANNIGPGTLNFPADISIGKLGSTKYTVVADRDNNRVLFYSTGHYPTAVLGQDNFVSADAVFGAKGIMVPQSVVLDPAGQRLFVASFYSVHVFDLSAGITSGMAASKILGLSDLDTYYPSYTGSCGNPQNKFGGNPEGMAYDPATHRLFVADRYNNRVLCFDATASAAGMTNCMPATCVIGQPSYYSTAQASGDQGMYQPTGVAWDAQHNRLFVSDYGNGRILAYNDPIPETGAVPVAVIGRSSYASAAYPGTFAKTVSGNRIQVSSDGNYLFLAENDRIKRFPVGSLSNAPTADVCPGLKNNDCSGYAPNLIAAGSDSILHMSTGSGMAWDAEVSRLYAADSADNRVLMFDSLQSGTTAKASDCLGQLKSDGTCDLTTLGANAVSSSSFNGPTALALAKDLSLLFVADSGNSRVLAYKLNSKYLLDDRLADFAIGSINGIAPPSSGLSADLGGPSKMLTPDNLAYTDGLLLVGDSAYQRIMVFEVGATSFTSGMDASFLIGPTSFSLTSYFSGHYFFNGMTLEPQGRYLFINSSYDSSTDPNNHIVTSDTKIMCIDLQENGKSLKTRIQSYKGTQTIDPYTLVDTGITASTGAKIAFSRGTGTTHMYFTGGGGVAHSTMNRDLHIFNYTSGCQGLTEAGSANLDRTYYVGSGGLVPTNDDQYLFISSSSWNSIAEVKVSDLLAAGGGTITLSDMLGHKDWSDRMPGIAEGSFNNPSGMLFTPDDRYLFVSDNGNSRGQIIKNILCAGLSPPLSNCE